MSFQALTFIIAGDRVERLADALLEAGALSVDVSDADSGTAAEQAAFGEPGSVSRPWLRARVSVLFTVDADATGMLTAAANAAAIQLPADVVEEIIEDSDWVRLTQSQFKPLHIAGRLWIVPTWERAPDPGAMNLVLDPGAAFGTGSHPTTRLCLRWLTESIRGGERVLDYGCGSGILAIAALRLGAGSARGVDIDPQAVIAARANAMQNRVAAEFAAPGNESGFEAHVVLANILANPLIALAPLLAAAVRPGGWIVLSGILADQSDGVAQAYSPWCRLQPARVEDGWALLVGQRAGSTPA